MFSTIDVATSPPRVDVPRDYNLAADLLDRHVIEGRGDRVAVIDDDGRHSYRWLAERARRAAAALSALGVVPEQRVALCMLDTVELPAAFLGAIALGAVPVPLNTLLAADDYRYLLRDCRARALIASDALLGKLAPAIADLPALQVAVAPSPLGGGGEWASALGCARRYRGAARGHRDHDQRRRRVLVVLVGLDGQAEGCDARPREPRAHRGVVRACDPRHRPRRRGVLRGEAVLRVRSGQRPHVSVLRRCHRRAACGATDAERRAADPRLAPADDLLRRADPVRTAARRPRADPPGPRADLDLRR